MLVAPKKENYQTPKLLQLAYLGGNLPWLAYNFTPINIPKKKELLLRAYSDMNSWDSLLAEHPIKKAWYRK